LLRWRDLPRFRLGRRTLRVAAALLIIFAGVTARVIVWPAQGMPTHVDAIVVLAGPGQRLPVATQLARDHRAPVLVVSTGHLGYGGQCPAPIPGVKIICFAPDPSNTRGEAEFAANLAKRSDWRSVVLVATRAQDTRARMLMSRCYEGSIYVITASQAWYDWPYQIAYGWAALLKALVVHRSC
jgi:uncharacterized SAM-binding protein YcdF (DUF218 family)